MRAKSVSSIRGWGGQLKSISLTRRGDLDHDATRELGLEEVGKAIQLGRLGPLDRLRISVRVIGEKEAPVPFADQIHYLAEKFNTQLGRGAVVIEWGGFRRWGGFLSPPSRWLLGHTRSRFQLNCIAMRSKGPSSPLVPLQS